MSRPVLVPATAPKKVPSYRRVLIRDLVRECSIGVHAHEHVKKQRIRVNLDLDALETDEPINDELKNVVCYDDILTAVRALIDDGHTALVETLAERIAGACFTDPRVAKVRVEVEKLDVYDDVASVGVAIERSRA